MSYVPEVVLPLENITKKSGFLMFSGGLERDQ